MAKDELFSRLRQSQQPSMQAGPTCPSLAQERHPHEQGQLGTLTDEPVKDQEEAPLPGSGLQTEGSVSAMGNEGHGKTTAQSPQIEVEPRKPEACTPEPSKDRNAPAEACGQQGGSSFKWSAAVTADGS